MSKIVIITAVFPPEPVVSAMLSSDIADELSKTNDVIVLCPKPTRPLGYDFGKSSYSSSYKVVQLDSYTCANSNLLGRLIESYSFGRKSKKYIKNNFSEIDCVYLNAWPLFSQYLIVKTASDLKIPSVIHIQDVYPESLTNKLPFPLNRLLFKIMLPLDILILKKSTKIIGISQNMISYLAKSRKVNEKKFELIRNWQNDKAFIERSYDYSEKECFVFLYLGSVSPSAGIETIIQSFHLANLPKSKLIIAGNGSDKENCMALSRRIGSTQIEFCDVKPENVPELQAQSDVLLLPLRKGIATTATPSKLTAYLLSAKPVLACVEEESDVANIISQAKCGAIVAPENVELIARALTRFYHLDKEILKKLGLNGKEYAILNLSRNANLKKIVTAIENFL